MDYSETKIAELRAELKGAQNNLVTAITMIVLLVIGPLVAIVYVGYTTRVSCSEIPRAVLELADNVPSKCIQESGA